LEWEASVLPIVVMKALFLLCVSVVASSPSNANTMKELVNALNGMWKKLHGTCVLQVSSLRDAVKDLVDEFSSYDEDNLQHPPYKVVKDFKEVLKKNLSQLIV